MSGKHMRCVRHGRIAWKLTIVCGGCGRFYQIVPDGQEFTPLCENAIAAPERCECGKRLAPETGVPGGGIYWARSCCTDCFKNEMLKKSIIKLPIREVKAGPGEIKYPHHEVTVGDEALPTREPAE